MMFSMPGVVPGEVAGKILGTSEFEGTTLNYGGRIEFLCFMGDGCGTD